MPRRRPETPDELRPRGVIVLEGADAAGKTTLADHLRTTYGARYLHNRVWPDMWKYHVASARLALRWAEDGLVVIDRLWLSELVYGQVYRGGPAYDLGARCLDRLLQRVAAVTVLCVPTELEAQLQRHAARLDRERYANVREAVALFADLRYGNLARPGSGYLGELIRYGTYAARSDVVVYDLDLHQGEAGVKRFARELLLRLGLLRSLQWPFALRQSRPNFLGHLGRASLVFVAEQLGDPATATPWPLFAPGSHLCAATYLNRALHRLAFDETRAVWLNAVSPDDQLSALVEGGELVNRRVVALGRVAELRLEALGRPADATLPHPQYWRRFRHHDLDGYADLLKKATSP